MGLQKQPVTVKLSGLDTKQVAGTSMPGRVKLAENVMGRKRTDGGIEFVKRYGRTVLSTDILGGGSIAAGKKLVTFGDELLMSDGQFLYSWASQIAKWVKRGKVSSVSAVVDIVDGNVGTDSLTTDVAYASGLAFYVAGNGVAVATDRVQWYVQDVATGTVVGRGNFVGDRPRVVTVGTAAFIFYHLASDSTLRCRTIAAATPSTIGSGISVASTGSSIFDVAVDTANARMVVAYRASSTSSLDLVIWNTGMTAGTTTSYSTRDPGALGFLHHDWSDGKGHLGICTSSGGGAAGVYVVEFDRTTLVVGSATQVDAAVTNAAQITGHVTGGSPRLVYDVPNGATQNGYAAGWNGTATFVFQRSVRIVSRMFKVGSLYYVLGVYHSTSQRNLYLFEFTGSGAASGDSGVSLAGYIMAGDSGGRHVLSNCLGSVVATTGTRYLASGTRLLDIDDGSNPADHAYALTAVTLDWSEDRLGAAVAYDGVLHIPGACPKVYDGQYVHEDGFLVIPEAPTLTETTGGSMTALGTYQCCVVWRRRGKDGRLQRSAPSAISTVTLTGANNAVTIDYANLRITETDARYNIQQEIGSAADAYTSVEIYWTKNGESIFYLDKILLNVVTADTGTTTRTISDANLADNEILYTQAGRVENITPPSVLAYAPWGGRLFAASGTDGAIWHTKKLEEGVASQFSGSFRVLLDRVNGLVTGLIPLDSTLVVTTRSKLFPITGDGPTPDGNNAFPYPLPLPADEGMVSPRAFAMTPAGPLLKAPAGIRLLDRGGALQPIEGADAYDSLTVTGGVALDDRPYSVLVTSDGRTLVRDWQLQQWYTWTNQAAVACCRWQNKLVFLASDGTVSYEDSTSYTDPSSTSINQKVRTGTLALADIFGRMRVYGVRVLGEAMASHTLSITTHMRLWDALTEETTTEAVTTATKFPLALAPAQERCDTLEITVEETSTTQGFALQALGLEIGVKPGASKQPTGQFMG